jgi:hypothetical protein
VNREVTEFLKVLQERMYTKTAPDRFGQVMLVPTGPLSQEDWGYLFDLVRDEQLITLMGSGLFGLSGYSLTAFEHPIQPGLDPEFVFKVYSDHVPEDEWPLNVHGRREAGKAFFDWVWEFFSQHTHSDRNREWLDLYSLWRRKHHLKMPGPRVSYDY